MRKLAQIWVWIWIGLSASYALAYPDYISLNGLWRYKVMVKPTPLMQLYRFHGTEKTMKIPTNWYLVGIDHWGVVWFQRSFFLPPKYKGKRVFVEFKGIDYFADIWVNGKFVGSHEGYFQSFCFDITDFVLWTRKNTITIRVDSPFEPIGEYWSLRKTLIKGVLNHHDTRPGGAWSVKGQDKNSGGIWGDVNIVVYDKVRIKKVKITPVLKNKALAILKVKFVLEKFTDEDRFKICLCVLPFNFKGKSQTFQQEIEQKKKGKEYVFTIKVVNPKLWASWDYGAPNLYYLKAKVFSYPGHCLFTKKYVFGIRSIKVDKNGFWYLNGKRIFLRGTNYISSCWLAEMTKKRFLKDLQMMKEANINIIRVHAHIEPEMFYQLADEMGIMVWQDFALQWGYSDDKEFRAEAVKQAREMVNQLYNHPSIVAWCGHNEPPWDAWWMKYKYDDYEPQQNKILDESIYAALKEEDQTRYVKAISATEEHPWYGWYSGTYQDYARPSKTPLVAEFGAQALPDLVSLLKIIPLKALFPKSEKDWQIWEYHNFQRHETFDLAKVPMGNDILAFIANTQNYQAKLIKYAAENLRLQKFHPLGAIFQFMFRETWPSINWGIVDYYQAPKKAYFSLKHAYQPLLPIARLQEKHKEIEIFVVNDLLKTFNLQVKWVVFDKDNKILALGEKAVNIKENSLQKVDTVKVKNGEKKVIVNLYKNGRLVSFNSYKWAF